MIDLDDEGQWIEEPLSKPRKFRDKNRDLRKQILDYSTHYYKNGRRHRIDGPAVIYHEDHPFRPNAQEWHLDGEIINCSSQQEFIRLVNLKAFW